MTYAFLKFVYGTDEIDRIMNIIEYAPHTDPHWDPFSVVYNVSNALSSDFDDYMLRLNRSLAQIRMRLCWIVLVQSALPTTHREIQF